MSPPLRSLASAALPALLALGLYAFRISALPLGVDETALLRQADTGGVNLFFQVSDDRWLPPIAVYTTRLVSWVAPADDAGRFASAAVGAINVALMFILSRRLFKSARLGMAAALLLLATPAHVVYARTGVDALYCVPFILLWLIGLTAYFEGGPPWAAAGGAFALGVGVYSQASAPLTMGFLLAVTLAAVWRSGCRDRRSLAGLVVAFAIPLAVAAAWFVAHPSQYLDTFGRWAIHPAHLRSPLDLARALANWNTLGTRLSLYWGFFDPSWLFLNGPSSPAGALHGAAPFLFATSLALVSGVLPQVRSGPAPVTVTLLAGLAVTPLAASTFGQPHAIDSALSVVPFVTVLAVGGLAAWCAPDAPWRRLLGWGALAALAIDFAAFYHAYWPG